MGSDDDIAGLLPDPPPPHPARRDATIALALRRFDGEEAPAPASRPRPAPASPHWWSLRGGQIGAFASIALVATVAISVGLQRPEEAPAPPPSFGPTAPVAPPAPPAAGERMATGQAARATVPAPAPARALPLPRADASRVPEPLPQAGRSAGYFAPAAPDLAERKAAPALAAAAPAPRARGTVQAEPNPAGAIVVTGSRRTAPMMESATPVTVIATADLADNAGEVVVTGSRVRPRKSAQPGDWNACTVNDPRRSLRSCKSLVDPGRKGDAGVAAAHLSDGLERAWQGDWRGALAAMDQAVALQPRYALAYLNRGLVHARDGDFEEAEADLDLAVRYAPRAARGYHSRSVVRRLRGDTRGADADAARAAQLDTRYEDLDD